ncbi:hypothetical protein [Glaciihabitans sp. UYNi722]|uniref:hypothetical protein n=1 Tax=Glaciihabitans sp. UYNi722 TaxID=3156344 RepID=UPI0033928893
MKKVAYGGVSFITTDEAADALLQFAAAAALNDFAEVVHLPAVDEDGRGIIADLVIGPASELLVTPSDSTAPSPDTIEAVNKLHARTVALGASKRVSIGLPIEDTEVDTSYLDTP